MYMKKFDWDDSRMRIIEEAALWNYPKLILSPANLNHLVMYETYRSVGVAFRDDEGQYYRIAERQASWSDRSNEDARAWIRDRYEGTLLDDRRILTRLYVEPWTLNDYTGEEIRLPMYRVGDVVEDTSAIFDHWLRYIREHAAPEDSYGIYGTYDTALWWWEEQPRVLHIMGSAAVHLVRDKMEYYEGYDPDHGPQYINDWMCHPQCMELCIGQEAEISRLVIHEGIRRFLNAPLMNRYWAFRIEELILPSTLYELPRLLCYVDHVTISETIADINLEDMWMDCGGHFDPVQYTIRSLHLPSNIAIDVCGEDEEEDYHGQLPLLEPIGYWEEIVLYGEEPIPDLAPWYKANVFLQDLIIRYPASWDDGAETSFANRVVAYVRSQNPARGRMCGMDAEWDDWEEEDYEDLRRRLIPIPAEAKESADDGKEAAVACFYREGEIRTQTYLPHPIDTSDIELPPALLELTEKIAENVHEVWSAGRIAQGWTYGPERNDAAKVTPCLLPYDALPDSEKEYDRRTAMETLKLIVKLGYRIN